MKVKLTKNVEGNLIINEEISQQILQRVEENSKLYEQATRVFGKIEGTSIKVPLSVDLEEYADFYADGEEVRNSNLNLKPLSLKKSKCKVCIEVSDELAKDSGFDIDEMLLDKFTKSLTKTINRAIVIGGGAIKGILENTDFLTKRAITVTNITTETIHDMIDLIPSTAKDITIFANKKAYKELRVLKHGLSMLMNNSLIEGIEVVKCDYLTDEYPIMITSKDFYAIYETKTFETENQRQAIKMINNRMMTHYIAGNVGIPGNGAIIKIQA